MFLMRNGVPMQRRLFAKLKIQLSLSMSRFLLLILEIAGFSNLSARSTVDENVNVKQISAHRPDKNILGRELCSASCSMMVNCKELVNTPRGRIASLHLDVLAVQSVSPAVVHSWT